MNRRRFTLILIGFIIGFKKIILSLFKRNSILDESEIEMDEKMLG